MNKINLHGLRVLNTRPKKQAAALKALIEKAGGQSIDCPALEIAAVDEAWISSLPPLTQVQQAIFISVNAVEFFFKAMQQNNLPWPDSIKVSAIGKATAQALMNLKIRVDSCPQHTDSEHLLAMENFQSVHQQLILLIKGKEGRTVIADTLTSLGANIHPVEVYERRLPSIDQQLLTVYWQDNRVDIILFTSQQAMHNLFLMFGAASADSLRQTPCLVISKRLADEAALMGIKQIYSCCPETIMEALHQFNQELIHD